MLHSYHNYHKRLGRYLSEPKFGLSRHKYQQFQDDLTQKKYINSGHQQKSAYFNKVLNDQRYNYYTRKSKQPSSNRNYYQQCQKLNNMTKNNLEDSDQRMLKSNQYFGPQIKSIAQTLINIRDHMIDKNMNKSHHTTNKKSLEIQNVTKNNELDGITKIQYKQNIIKDLEFKIREITLNIQKLQNRNNYLEDQLLQLSNKSKQYHDAYLEQHKRLSVVQSQKTQLQERQRDYQIKMMDLRSESIKKDQHIRQLQLNSERKIQQIQQLLNRNSFKITIGVQTQEMQIGLQGRLKDIDQMQDSLCTRINNNLKVERRIFARLQDIDENLRMVYENMHKVQQEAFRLGVSQPYYVNQIYSNTM